MAAIVFKIILGLFIWLVLPDLIIKGKGKGKGKKKKSPYRKFVNIACAILGIVIVASGGYDLLTMLLS
ncbi:MAG: hypothetical protein LBR84_04495 [Tannerella sp.]|jgi:hypothetical protein|nr:hypothetical protein [Tannerella sp.]